MTERSRKPGDDFPHMDRSRLFGGLTFFCHENLINQVQTKAKQKGCGTHKNLISEKSPH